MSAGRAKARIAEANVIEGICIGAQSKAFLAAQSRMPVGALGKLGTMTALLKDRLAEAMVEAKATQADLARHCGISRASVNGWLSGATKSLDGANLTKAAEYLHVTPGWLAGTSTQKRPIEARDSALAPILAWEHTDELPYGEYVLVPRLAIRLAAGHGADNSHQVQVELSQETPQAFRAEWIRRLRLRPNRLAAMQAAGNSMEPRIHDGDSLLIDTSQTQVRDGGVYALWYDGGERVKRLFLRPGGGLLLRSDNPMHPEITLSHDEAACVRVIGRIVHVSGVGGL